MKSKFLLLYLFLLSSILFACNSPESEVKATFVGIIEEVHEDSATVSVIEAEGTYKISGLVNIDLFVNPKETFEAGNKIKVGYDGTVMEISPLAIKTLTLEKYVYTAERHSTKPTNLHMEGITFSSRMFKNMISSKLPGGEILGGKTGYTEDAGLCLASLAIVNSQEYILVTVGADGSPQTEQYNIRIKTGIAYIWPISNFQPIVLYPSEAGSITAIIQTIK